MKQITLFNAYKKTTRIIKEIDASWARLFVHETEKIAQHRQRHARYERLQHKLDFRIAYFLEWGKAPRANHCVICGWWENACDCKEYHPSQWERELLAEGQILRELDLREWQNERLTGLR